MPTFSVGFNFVASTVVAKPAASVNTITIYPRSYQGPGQYSSLRIVDITYLYNCRRQWSAADLDVMETYDSGNILHRLGIRIEPGTLSGEQFNFATNVTEAQAAAVGLTTTLATFYYTPRWNVVTRYKAQGATGNVTLEYQASSTDSINSASMGGSFELHQRAFTITVFQERLLPTQFLPVARQPESATFPAPNDASNYLDPYWGTPSAGATDLSFAGIGRGQIVLEVT